MIVLYVYFNTIYSIYLYFYILMEYSVYMKQLVLELYDIDVCTVNNARYRNGNRTKAARDYAETVHREMYRVKDQVREFRAYFNSLPDTEKELHLEIDILVPQHRMYTKAGAIHKDSIDIDNYLKLLIDAVMDARYNGKCFKHGNFDIVNLSMNDKYITRLIAEKSENPDPKTELWDISFTLTIL